MKIAAALILLIGISLSAHGDNDLRRIRISALEKITIPDFSVSQMPLKGVVALLKEQALKSDPSGSGINVVIKRLPTYELPKISISLKAPTVGEVVAAIQAQTDMIVIWEHESLIFEQSEDWKNERMKDVLAPSNK